MSRYDKILNEITVDKLRIKTKERQLRKELRKEYKWFFLAMDILMILFFVLNMGALVITNALAVKVEPEVKIYEANPVYAQVAGLETHPNSNKLLNIFYFKAVGFAFIFGVYLLLRLSVNRKDILFIMGLMVLSIFMLGCIDFFNNLGFLIGKLVYN